MDTFCYKLRFLWQALETTVVLLWREFISPILYQQLDIQNSLILIAKTLYYYMSNKRSFSCFNFAQVCRPTLSLVFPLSKPSLSVSHTQTYVYKRSHMCAPINTIFAQVQTHNLSVHGIICAHELLCRGQKCY